MKIIFTFLLIINVSIELFSQKPSIDHSVYGNWTAVSGAKINNNGRYVMFTTELSDKSFTLTIKSTVNNWEISIPEIKVYDFSNDGKFGIVQKSDQLILVKLGDNERTSVSNIRSWKISGSDSTSWLAWTNAANELNVQNLLNGDIRKYGPIETFSFSNNGSSLVYEINISKIDSVTKEHKQLHWLDLESGRDNIIWYGSALLRYLLDPIGDQLICLGEATIHGKDVGGLWYYKKGNSRASLLVQPGLKGIESNLKISKQELSFSSNGKWIIFNLEPDIAGSKEEFFAKLSDSELSEWLRKLMFDPSLQPWNSAKRDSNAARVMVRQFKDNKPKSINNKTAVVGTHGEENVIIFSGEADASVEVMEIKGDVAIVAHQREYPISSEWRWNPAAYRSVYLISLKDGKWHLLKDSLEGSAGKFSLSPSGRFMLYVDPEKKRYESYETATAIWRDLRIDPNLDCSRSDQEWPIHKYTMAYVESWLESENSVLLNDRHDIWKVDLNGRSPMINITRQFGRKNHISFRFMRQSDQKDQLDKQNVSEAPEGGFWLTSFNEKNKSIGFFKLSRLSGEDPRLQSEDTFSYDQFPYVALIRAKSASIYLVRRQNVRNSPNYYTTEDFKTFKPISKCAPEREFNWMTSELIRWKTSEGIYADGILYKPENFDSTKKYPIVFTIYEEESHNLHQYLSPQVGGNTLSTVWLVSNGYLVFKPDIHYKVGTPGKSAVDHVVTAAKFLATKPWINRRKMAIQGASWGGYQVNYIVTHTNLFAAAYSGCGPSNLISSYGSEKDESISEIESGQLRIGTGLWQAPNLFIQGSPVFYAPAVSTPILIMHNKNDHAVPYAQGLQFYNCLRRLGKRAWMLEYESEGHAILEKTNFEDFSKRLEQFFEHFLKEGPPPKWMTEGVPEWEMEIESSFELDQNAKPFEPNKVKTDLHHVINSKSINIK